MGMAFKIALLILWSVFFLQNLYAITLRKVDAGTGVLWMVIAALLIVGIAALDSELLASVGNVAMIALFLAQFLLVGVLFDHEKRLTEVRRKNNELAMQIALIYDHMKYFEKKPTAVNKNQMQA